MRVPMAPAPTADRSSDDDVAADEPPPPPERLPTELLGVLGGLVSGLGVDEDAFGRVLSGVLPPEAPSGYSDDGRGSLRRDVPKVGRNEPCPCGSGKKYKRCCLAEHEAARGAGRVPGRRDGLGGG